MVSIQIKLIKSSKAAEEGTLCYVIKLREVKKVILTTYTLLTYEWDEERSIIAHHKASYTRRSYLERMERNIIAEMDMLNRIIIDLTMKNCLSVKFIAENFAAYFQKTSLFAYLNELIIQFKAEGRIKTSSTYASALRSFSMFRQGEDIRFDAIDALLIKKYESYLQIRKVVPNTISFYMRILRAVYNRAVDLDLTTQNYPFKNVYTGVERTAKRAIDVNVIRYLRDMSLLSGRSDTLARDLFLFSFYARGMPFVDMAHLRKTDVEGNYLVYRRRKTKRVLKIRLERPMEEIINHYTSDTGNSPWLLPILYRRRKNISYQTALRMHNKRLKILSQKLLLPTGLTSYVARHSWATMAKIKGVAIQTISESMGHESVNTTRIYLASLDQTVIDDANALILSDMDPSSF